MAGSPSVLWLEPGGAAAVYRTLFEVFGVTDFCVAGSVPEASALAGTRRFDLVVIDARDEGHDCMAFARRLRDSASVRPHRLVWIAGDPGEEATGALEGLCDAVLVRPATAKMIYDQLAHLPRPHDGPS
jgi:DNA-binding response OmpR family regulator